MHKCYVITDGINTFEQTNLRKTETCFIFYSHKGIRRSDSAFHGRKEENFILLKVFQLILLV